MTNEIDKHLQIHAVADNDPSLPDAARDIPLEDPKLALQLQEIRLLKEMLRTAYPAQPTHPPRGRLSRLASLPVLVTVFMLSLAALIGALWLSLDRVTVQPVQLVGETPNTTQVIVFLDSAETAKFDQVLDVAEEMLSRPGMEINVVASAGGLDMLRQSTSPVAKRVVALSSRHEALLFYACNKTLTRLQREGQDTGMLETANVKLTESALDFVMRHVKDGWQFIAI